MKMMKFKMLVCLLALAGISFTSCNNDEGYSLDKAWYSIATLNPMGDSKSYWLTLDDGTTIWPVATNIPWFYPKERQRAFVIYTLLSDEFQGYSHAAKILDIETILTKPIAENLGDGNDEKYGADPVKITDIWIGDGFLNIVFDFDYGGNAVHYINLIPRNDADTPYSFEFRHNAYNDDKRYRRSAIVAFDLSSIKTEGEVELAINVQTFDGEKVYKVKCDSSNPTLKTFAQNKSYKKDKFIKTR